MNTEELEKLNDLALSVLKLSRNTLVIHLRFMDTAISRLQWINLPELIAQRPELATLSGSGLCTQGTSILYDPVFLCRLYAREKENGPRAYLHMVMHCIFRHFLVSPSINQPLWNLACDMAVEGVINGLDLPALMTSRVAQQQKTLQDIAPKVNQLLTAEKIYHWLQGARLSEVRLAKLQGLFGVDSHAAWYMRFAAISSAAASQTDSKKQKTGSSKSAGSSNDNGQNNEDDDSDCGTSSARDALEQDWKDISEHIQLDLETFSKQQGDQAGGMMQNLQEVNREKYDYTAFLKKFAVMGEVMKINQDEFDYVFYTYGMKLFPEKRLPLIEPLEYKDVKRIREFVIAIDTSGSVAGDEVQSFLQKTYNILKSTDSFFNKINLHIIQCDAAIQEDVKITCQEDFDRYLKNMTIKGLGGTDFRPVFRRVDEMLHNREFTNLKGLIYFTDGYGTFPDRMPAYKTTFVFVKDGYDVPDVPVWAMKLVLQKNEL